MNELKILVEVTSEEMYGTDAYGIEFLEDEAVEF